MILQHQSPVSLRLACVAAIASLGLLASPAPAGAVAAPVTADTAQGPSIMQVEDLAHRNQPLNLAPATSSPARLAPGPRTATSATTGYTPSLRREVLGFATYWELADGNLSDIELDKLSTIAYFGLTYNGNGTFASDSGMTGWNSQALSTLIGDAHAAGDRVVLVVKCFDDPTINSIVHNPATAQTAISNAIAEVKSKQLDGVNVDFEGATSSTYPTIQQDYTNWIASLSQQLRAAVPGAQLTVDSYSGAASWTGGFMRIDALAPYVDAFFVMAYDMNSPNDLPNAPLSGPYTYNDTTSVSQYLSQVGGDGTKVILGVPYYGYKFSTSSPAFHAPVTQGQVAETYADFRADAACASGPPDNITLNWDSPSSTPWAAWWSPASGDPCLGNHGSWREVYYDDAASLGAKYDLVNSQNIRGTGMWALGFDHGYTDLWQEIAVKLMSPSAAWSAWAPLGGWTYDNPAAATNSSGSLEVFMRGGNGTAWHNWQTSSTASGWSGWVSLGGPITGSPVAARNAGGALEVFAAGPGNQVWHTWQQPSAPGGWSGWISLGGSASAAPAVATNSDSRLEVFTRAADGSMWHAWQTPATPSGWSGWAPLGGAFPSTPSVALNSDGRLELFATGSDGGLWHDWQANTASGWSGWAPLGGSLAGNAAVGVNGSGSLEAFARSGDGSIWHKWQAATASGWSDWASLGGRYAGDPAVGRDANGDLAVFVTDAAGAVWHDWQSATATGWSGWFSLHGAMTGRASVATNADGRLEIFMSGTDNQAWHSWEVAAFK